MSQSFVEQPMKLVPDVSQGMEQAKMHYQHVEIIETNEPRKVSATKFENIETLAFVVQEPKADFTLVPIILDEIRADEVLVDMSYSGICHTDIVLQQGLLPMVEFPAVFGHEGAGIVRAVGSDVSIAGLEVGDSVVLSFNHCGTCKACVSDHPAFCFSHPQVNHNAVRISDRSTPGRLKDGLSVRTQYFGQSSFSKMSVVNAKCVVKCPRPEDMHLYAPLGCGIQTGAGTVLNVLKPTSEDSLVIFGLGSVGLAAVMAAKYLGVGKIIAVDIMPTRLELGRELGATDTLNSREESNIVQTIKNLTGGGAKFAVDCTGIPKVIEDVVASIGPMGTAVVVGVPPPGADVKVNALEFLLENKKFVGVIEGDSNPSKFIPQLIDLHRAGEFPLEKLCKNYHFSELPQAVADMHSGKVIKPVIKWC
ncbi:hypothetical protein NW756_012662 [Fusarium oxysporum]|uniref:Aryl-alcohol dehydrogenase n=1 Tax=Fusarium oxysporum f. sp. raphani TaxID=96318 RepID=A0A8J5PPS3_FUSOX|nr:Aryl-alcohol dehydrogenase [Fusarium oxysporum f. sp. raphani]KAJ4037538.1 hypothetical protein NW753_011443 [Fusarium oxysporum]KAJ4048433.1 hypothetical protein NW763_009847 [Fusarium oxysporum]KAJ4076653.1 hypothetical protein NW756_012662 [Fusarium oxysporum]KAJ4100688.1 hypothetical protein NW769_010344 [Fusarium oxysporum]